MKAQKIALNILKKSFSHCTSTFNKRNELTPVFSFLLFSMISFCEPSSAQTVVYSENFESVLSNPSDNPEYSDASYLYCTSCCAGSTSNWNGRVGTNPNVCYGTVNTIALDHTTGSGKSLIENTNLCVPGANATVWGTGTPGVRAAITVRNGAQFTYGIWLKAINGSTAAVLTLRWSTDGSTWNNLASLSATTTWAQLTGSFTATSASVYLDVTNATIATTGNDFAIDDITLTQTTLLPVTLVNFGLTPGSNCSMKVSWQTTDAIGTNDFLVQKSQDGNTWATIADIPAINSDQVQSYSFTDNNFIGGNYYCRLQVNDVDGVKSYSNIAHANINCNNGDFSFLPQPISNQLTVRVPSAYSSNNNLNLCIYNYLGQCIKKIKLVNGDEETISTETWPKGGYIAIVTENGIQLKVRKIVKW